MQDEVTRLSSRLWDGYTSGWLQMTRSMQVRGSAHVAEDGAVELSGASQRVLAVVV